MARLGKVFLPEQYAPADMDVVTFDNDLAVKESVELTYKELDIDGIVFLVRVETNYIQKPTLLFWAYYTENHYPILTPLFKEDVEIIEKTTITNISIVDHEVLIYGKSGIYSSLYTDKGHIVIKKLINVLEEDQMATVATLLGDECDYVLLVRAFAASDHRFLGFFWEVMTKDNQCLLYPISCNQMDDDNAQIKAITYPIDENEIIDIEGKKYILTFEDNQFILKPYKLSKKGKKELQQKFDVFINELCNKKADKTKAKQTSSAVLVSFKPKIVKT